MADELERTLLLRYLRETFQHYGCMAVSFEEFREKTLAKQGGDSLPEDAVVKAALRTFLKMPGRKIFQDGLTILKMFLRHGCLMFYLPGMRATLPSMLQVEFVQVCDIARLSGADKLWQVADPTTDVLVLIHGFEPGSMIIALVERPEPAAG